MKNCLLVLIYILINLGCARQEPLILATYSYSNNDRIANIFPLAEALSKSIDLPIEVKSYADVNSLIEAILIKDVDIALINTHGFLILEQYEHDMEPLVALNSDNLQELNYRAVILSREANKISSIEELKKKSNQLKFMFVAEQSTSGYFIPKRFLSKIGIDNPKDTFKKVEFGGNHQDTFDLLLKGATDLIAVGSNEYYTQLTNNPSLKEEIELVWMSGEIPLGPVIVSERLRPEKVHLIQNILLDIHISNPEAFDAVKMGWSEARNSNRFIEVSDTQYNSLGTL